MRFKTEVCSCSIFPTEAVLWFKEGDGGSGGLRIFAIHSGNYSFSRFSNIGRKNCILHHPEFLLQEEVHSGGTEDSRRRRLIPPWQTHRTSDLRMSARRALTRPSSISDWMMTSKVSAHDGTKISSPTTKPCNAIRWCSGMLMQNTNTRV